MLHKKQGYPDEEELVLCTVTNVQHHSVFVNLDEYSLSGMIHISEVSPGRIRNIRDFVKEGKVIVCKVLSINTERRNIDLSLRRVTEAQRRAKINEIKQVQKAEKIVEFIARKLGKDTNQLYADITSKVLDKYSNLYIFFEEVSQDEKLATQLGLSPDITLALLETIKTRIKPSSVEISGKLVLTSFESNGVETIKNILIATRNTDMDKIAITYAGGGRYNLTVMATDYKTAEKVLSKATTTAIDMIEKKSGMGEFVRDDKR